MAAAAPLVSSLIYILCVQPFLQLCRVSRAAKSGCVFGRRFRAITSTTFCRLSFRRRGTLPFTSARPQSCTPAPPMQSMDVQPSSSVTSLQWSRSMRYHLPASYPHKPSCAMHCHHNHPHVWHVLLCVLFQLCTLQISSYCRFAVLPNCMLTVISGLRLWVVCL